jgi:hypothetical protein
MKISNTLLVLSLLIALLGAAAAAAGIWGQGQGDPIPFTTLRGETVEIQGRGLYYYDSVSGAAQVIGGDFVTLFLAVPMLLYAVRLSRQGSLRGRLLLSGTLAYFLYTYISITFLLAYNQLFLLYTALYSLSLFAFIISLVTIDIKSLPAYFSESTPRLPVAAFLFCSVPSWS